MAKETALWQRCRTGLKNLEACGYKVHYERHENMAGEGCPDVEGCLDGAINWIELKTNKRPAKPATVIRSKTRESQSIWHNKRTRAGSRHHWVLIQVGEANSAKLYLIPGRDYDEVITTEANLSAMSVLPPEATMSQVLLRASEGW